MRQDRGGIYRYVRNAVAAIVAIFLIPGKWLMNSKLTYEQVVHLLAKSESDEFIQQVIILLAFTHEIIDQEALNKQDFVFTLFDEGHILITDIISREPDRT